MGVKDDLMLQKRGKKPKSSDKGSGTAAPVGGWRFVASNLSQADKAEFKAWYEEAEDLLALMAFYAARGVKISASYAESTSSYVVAATCKAVDSPAYGATFSSHAADFPKALAVTLWKLEFRFILEEDWGTPPNSADDWG